MTAFDPKQTFKINARDITAWSLILINRPIVDIGASSNARLYLSNCCANTVMVCLLIVICAAYYLLFCNIKKTQPIQIAEHSCFIIINCSLNCTSSCKYVDYVYANWICFDGRTSRVCMGNVKVLDFATNHGSISIILLLALVWISYQRLPKLNNPHHLNYSSTLLKS